MLSYRISQDRASPAGIVARLARLILTVIICSSLFLVSITSAQRVGKTERKVIGRVLPVYPKLLKDAGIGGNVRLNATVLANGAVINVEILGGNPILGESAVQAVRHWRFAAGPSQTNEQVIISFNPH